MQTYSEIGQDEARLAIDTCLAELQARGKAAVIAVGDRHGELIALLRMDGAPLPSVLVAANKVYTTARERRASGDVGRAARAEGWDVAFFGDPRYIGWEGGALIRRGGQVLGAVSVSGLAGEEDFEIAQKGVDAVLAHIAAHG